MNTEILPVEKKRELTYFENIILFFFIYSFIGWAIETVYCYFEMGYLTKRGFLLGPICPIYGNGALILLLILQPYKENKFKLFCISAIVFTIFEYIVGYGLDALFAIDFWDYSTHLLNLNGRITLEFSFVWGIFAILFISYVHPFIKKYLKKILNIIPSIVQPLIVKVLCVVFVVDMFLSFIRYLL